MYCLNSLSDRMQKQLVFRIHVVPTFWHEHTKVLAKRDQSEE